MTNSLADLFLAGDGWTWGSPNADGHAAISHANIVGPGMGVSWRTVIAVRMLSFRGGPRPNPLVKWAQADYFGSGVGRGVFKTTGRSELLIMTARADHRTNAPRPLRKYTLAEAVAAEALLAICGERGGLPAAHNVVHDELIKIAERLSRQPWTVKREVQRLSQTWQWL